MTLNEFFIIYIGTAITFLSVHCPASTRWHKAISVAFYGL